MSLVMRVISTPAFSRGVEVERQPLQVGEHADAQLVHQPLAEPAGPRDAHAAGDRRSTTAPR